MKATTLVRILTLALPLALFGCGHGHDHSHDGDHSHEHGDDHSHGNGEEHAHEEEASSQVTAADASAEPNVIWSCPMHPEITSKEAGRCSKCGMFLTRPDADPGEDHGDDGDEHHSDEEGSGHDKDEGGDGTPHSHGKDTHQH